MAFPLKLRKMPKDEIDRKVKEAAATLDITQYLNRKPKADVYKRQVCICCLVSLTFIPICSATEARSEWMRINY